MTLVALEEEEKKKRQKDKRRDAPGKVPVERRGPAAGAQLALPGPLAFPTGLSQPAFQKGAPWEGKTNMTGHFDGGVVFFKTSESGHRR